MFFKTSCRSGFSTELLARFDMALLDNAVWLTGTGGTAVGGTTNISEGGNSTTVTGKFTAGSWDASQGGNNISEFGAFATSSPIEAKYHFSNPVENLSFAINHLNDDGGSTYDDYWTISAYDENGDQIPASEIIAGLGGLVDENIITNPDGSVSIEAAGTTINDVTVNLTGPVSGLQLTFEPGPNGTATGGSGISDLSFDIPAIDIDTDGDGVADSADLDTDGDGILDTDEGYSTSTPSTITVTFDGDEYAADASDNTRWELRDPDGNLIASDSAITSSVKVTDVPTSGIGEYSFTVFDDYGDGLSGVDAASFTVSVDGVTVIDSGANPNFGTTFSDTFSVKPVETSIDSDGDGFADYMDLDSDNDGITDNVEAQTTAGYVAPTGTDSDGDGLDDAYEGTGNEGLTPVNTDGTGLADYLDTDSDDDGIADVDEAGHGVSQASIDASGDADGDGIADVVDDVSGWDVNDADVDAFGNFTLSDSDNDTAADGSNASPMTQNFDYRETIPCFTLGAMILTPQGERAVETLRVGDLVVTQDHGPQPIRWAGSRTVLSQGDFAPISISAGALEGLKRPLLVSPQHRFLFAGFQAELLFNADEVFVSAKHLIGAKGICQKNSAETTYLHVMLDQHEVIYVNGIATESFFAGTTGVASVSDKSREEMFQIFPDLRSNVGSYGPTARDCLTGREAKVLVQELMPQTWAVAA
ncbi:Hint domain-containing protein [Sulfitobacter mediterraneus]|uniref:Hint domain-containing protein n=1 Tax=Sulfitobacter mediterraneus TaxID=83219 RepID=UPI000EA2DB89|nr:Hint domain-containing protein [Sulfitobacter mediterraneus]